MKRLLSRRALRPALVAILAVVGCEKNINGAPEGTRPVDLLPPDGRASEFADEGDTSSAPLFLRVDGRVWTLKSGPAWADAAEVGVFDVVADAGLWIDEQMLVPQRVLVGEVGEGVEITAIGPVETYYGTFDPAVSVEIDDGRFEGAWVLAQGYGPIVLSVDGDEYELVYYE